MSMENTVIFNSDNYDDGRTKQSFKDETDINMILARSHRGEAITHLAKYEAQYGDFSDISSLQEAHDRLQVGLKIFDDLPGEVKREFQQSPKKFFEYVNHPENKQKLDKLIPGLTQPGNQLFSINRTPANQGVTTPPQQAPTVESTPPVDQPTE